MKRRIPGEFATAVSQIRDLLGELACARAVDRSRSLIRKWCDPDNSSLPSLVQSVALDAAVLATGHERAPILATYAMRVEHGMPHESLEGIDVVREVLGLQAAVGAFASQLLETLSHRTSPDDELSAEEKSQLLAFILKLRDHSFILERHLST